MVLSPDIQKKAQEEIDRVIGSNRLASFADKSSLPYISCIVWECLRWNPVAPMGGAHFTTKDDQYNGYQIPKGSTVMANVWYDTRILKVKMVCLIFPSGLFFTTNKPTRTPSNLTPIVLKIRRRTGLPA